MSPTMRIDPDALLLTVRARRTYHLRQAGTTTALCGLSLTGYLGDVVDGIRVQIGMPTCRHCIRASDTAVRSLMRELAPKPPATHVCRESETCVCRMDADEPSEQCPVHGFPWPPRCDCGRFVP